jgi:hypothetical protein
LRATSPLLDAQVLQKPPGSTNWPELGPKLGKTSVYDHPTVLR